MKYIFVAGLEHSGTTLTDYLLSQSSGALGLGEVTQFFSPKHMQQYINKWGNQPDVELCSCKANWAECDFWHEICNLNGLNSDLSIADKYRALFSHIKQTCGSNKLVIDSSKTIEAFKKVEPVIEDKNLVTKIHIVFTCKDVRGFAMSIMRKNNSSSLFQIYQSFNWWLAANQRWLSFLEQGSYAYTVNLYESLCRSPQALVEQVMGKAINENGLNGLGVSHIAMGNKDFTMRNSNHIKYDDEWRFNWKIKLIYFFHRRARKLNSRLYQLAIKE